LRLPRFTEELTLSEDKESTLDEWKEEALRLEKQGKVEQALDIQKFILGEKKLVPWPVMNSSFFKTTSIKMTQQSLAKIDKNERGFFLDFAINDDISRWIQILLQGRMKNDFTEERTSIKNRYYLDYLGKNYRNLEKKIADYGVDFRNQFNQTPLHIAAIWGVFPLLNVLKDQGAATESLDTFGRNPLSYGFFLSLQNDEYREKIFPQLYEALSDVSLNFQSQKKLVKLARRSFEYFLFYLIYNHYLSLVLGEKAHSNQLDEKAFFFDSKTIAKLVGQFPDSVVGEHRKRKTYISSLLSKNEVSKIHPYNRGLFIRINRGQYVFNSKIFFSLGEDEWMKLDQAMGLPTLADVLKVKMAAILYNLWASLHEASPVTDAGDVCNIAHLQSSVALDSVFRNG
jgi:hypothetical protein